MKINVNLLNNKFIYREYMHIINDFINHTKYKKITHHIYFYLKKDILIKPYMDVVH